MTLAAAIARIQVHALAVDTISPRVKDAGLYPVEDASMLPKMATYFENLTANAEDATTVRILYNVNSDLHLSRDNLYSSYEQLTLFVESFLRRLWGDPTLDGAVQTISAPITGVRIPDEYNMLKTLMVRFTTQIKLRPTPLT